MTFTQYRAAGETGQREPPKSWFKISKNWHNLKIKATILDTEMVDTAFLNLLNAIGQTDSRPDPFDLHGTLCGILCGGQHQKSQDWVKKFASQASDEEQKKLLHLLKLTQVQLDSPDLDFRLLLPKDEQSLSKRTEGLASWCRGFLYGLGIGGLAKDTALDKDALEFLRDVAEIAKAKHHSQDDAPESEAAYYEIVEYLRMGVLLIYESLHSIPKGSIH